MLYVHSAQRWVSLAEYPVFASKFAMMASCFDGGVEKHFSEISRFLEEKYSDLICSDN